MRNNMRLSACAALLACCMSEISAENVLLTTPEGFEILSVSANGKWACGAYRDMANSFTGFRWNLESGTVEMLGEGPSMAYGVADDGTVSGEFYDKSLYDNGAGKTMPGYWRDGSWHSVEVPAGHRITDEAIGYGISRDGHYMVGSLPLDGVYTPFIWKDGKIHRQLPCIDNKSGVPFAVSNDGNRATGFIEKENRTACYWDADGGIRYLEECEGYKSSPWNYGRAFSPDGTKVVYWGGLEESAELGTTVLYCIYDITTDQVTTVPGDNINTDVEFHGITDNCTLVGEQYGRAFLWNPETGGAYIEDYLDSKGVEFGDIFYDFYQDVDYIPITKCVSISADEKVLGMRYVNKNLETVSLVVKLDQDLSEAVPVDFTAAQLAGIKTVALKWKKPVGATLKGYTVYRDGRKISGFMPISKLHFYDKDVEEGEHTYEIAAVNLKGQEYKCEPLTVTVSAFSPDEKPYNVSARQKGVNRSYLQWEAPASNCIHKNYVSPAAPGLEGLNIYAGIEVENAVRFSKEELANYQGCKISEVSFRPMGSNLAWVVNLYSYNPDTEELTLMQETELDEEPVVGKTYAVRFENPLELPEEDLVVGVLTLIPDGGGQSIAALSGKSEPGYSDLMRSPDDVDDSFFSATEKSAESGSYTSYTWAIDLGLTAADGTGAALSPEGYRLYIDDSEAIETATTEFVTGALADGMHTVAVEAVYPDGSASPRVETSLPIVANYPAARNVQVEQGQGEESRQVNISWDAPADDDMTDVSYTDAQNYSIGVQATEATEYEFMAAALYPAKKFSGYEGYEIRTARFFPLTDADYLVMVAQGEDIITGCTVKEVNKGMWNEIAFPEPVTVQGGKDYMLAIYVGTPTPETDALGIDDVPPIEYYSDLISLTGGQSWMSLGADAGASGSWMMGLRIFDPEAPDLEVDGYNVVIDERQRNEETLTETSYQHRFQSASTRPHSLRIDTLYPELEGAVEGDVTYFSLSASGVDNGTIETVRLVRGSNCLLAEGEGVEQICVYDLSGLKVASAKGCKVEIGSLAPGVYVVEIGCADKTVTRKINIVK